MSRIDLDQAKQCLEDLVEQASRGEEVIITRGDGAAFRLVPTLSETPLTGADLVAFWQAEGVIGARPEVTDAQAHARQLRHAAERRQRP